MQNWQGIGRKPHDRSALSNAFVAKAVLGLAATRTLIERLAMDRSLKRLCGSPSTKGFCRDYISRRGGCRSCGARFRALDVGWRHLARRRQVSLNIRQPHAHRRHCHTHARGKGQSQQRERHAKARRHATPLAAAQIEFEDGQRQQILRKC